MLTVVPISSVSREPTTQMLRCQPVPMAPTIQSVPLAQPRSVHMSWNEPAPPPPMAKGDPERATTFLLASRTSKDFESPLTVYPWGHTGVVTESPVVFE